MIRVRVAYQDEPVVLDSDVCTVDDGTLIVFRDSSAQAVIAGFAPGVWGEFILDTEGGYL